MHSAEFGLEAVQEVIKELPGKNVLDAVQDQVIGSMKLRIISVTKTNVWCRPLAGFCAMQSEVRSTGRYIALS